MNRSSFLIFIPLCVVAQFALSQSLEPRSHPQAGFGDPVSNLDSATTTRSNYNLGPFDQFTLMVTDLDDFTPDKNFRIDIDGEVSLPIIGRLHAGGLTARGLEGEIRERLVKVLKDPDVVLTITEFGSQSASILGAVGSPGIYQLRGRKTLFELLSLGGGTSEDAGTTVKISRDLKWGPIPISNAIADPTGHYSVASVKVRGIMNAVEPAQNIMIMPGDTVTVPRAELVYVVGFVTKPGGFPLHENETISTLQAVALAQGLQKTAAQDKARILRAVAGSKNRIEIPVNIKQLMGGKADDVPLRPDDILFVPGSGAKSAGYRTIDALVAAATLSARAY